MQFKSKKNKKKKRITIPAEIYDGFVYFAAFALSQEMRFIKIGFAKNVQKRIDSISVPAPLYLIGQIPGNYKLEKSIHERLKLYNQYREWYEDNQDVRNYINSLLKIKRVIPENYICISFIDGFVSLKFMIGATQEEMDAIKQFSDNENAYFIKSDRALYHKLISENCSLPIDPIGNKYYISDVIEDFLKEHTSYPHDFKA